VYFHRNVFEEEEIMIYIRTVTVILTAIAVVLLFTSSAWTETEPALSHPQQQQTAEAKLKSLEEKTGKKPNILILLVDDMGWGDPGVYGGGEAVGAPTPNIDRMAEQGLKLTSAYSQSTCSPTRATINTGRLPSRHGILRPPMYGEKGGLTDEITAAQLLSEAGYVTAMVGKWHLGEAEKHQPQNMGYDEFFGFLGVSNIYSEWRDQYFNPELVHNPEMQEMIRKAAYNKHLVRAKKGGKVENLKEITIPVLANIDQDFTDYTVDFLKRQKDSNKPFYLIHSFSKVHFDNYPADGYKGKSPAKFPYKDAMIEVDDIVGRILRTLEETGQADNTFVYFTSDNGVEEDNWPDAGYAPWRGGKGTAWEGGVRVPGIVHWPGTIKAGRVSDGLFDNADLFNTSLALAGTLDKLPTDRYIDGIDQTSFLLADDGESNREVMYYWNDGKFSAARWREYKWYREITLIGSGSYEAVGAMNLGVQVKPNKAAVFNLYTDPRERKPQIIRKTWLAQVFQPIFVKHMATYKKYPGKVIVDLK
jgi:arylsulfatase A-like enzyme